MAYLIHWNIFYFWAAKNAKSGNIENFYKGMASGTSGETDQDHTSYKFETAGFNASPKLLPVFMDYLLSPNLTVCYYLKFRFSYKGKSKCSL